MLLSYRSFTTPTAKASKIDRRTRLSGAEIAQKYAADHHENMLQDIIMLHKYRH